MKRKERKLTRLILAALMSAGGVLLSGPSEVAIAAQETNVVDGSGTTHTKSAFGNHNDDDITVKNENKPVSGNIVNVDLGTDHVQSVFGAQIMMSADKTADNNTVNVKRGTIADHVVGGYANNTTVQDNQVNITDGNIGDSSTDMVIGGQASNGANTNHVTISGGTIAGKVFGGDAWNPGATVSGNTVTISGDTTAIAGDVCGGHSEDGIVGGASADEGNKVTISGGTINGYVYGGYSHKGDLSSTGDVTYNTVNISGTSTNIGENIYGGYSDSGAASNNTVTISGGTIGADDTKEVVGGLSATGEASNNTVEISGGTIKGYIRGGSGDKANKNTITISKDAKIVDGTARIYGAMGFSEANNNTVNILVPIQVLHLAGGDGAPGTGNTLNLAAKGVTVGTEGVLGFQNLNFFLPTDMTTSDTMLTVNGTAKVDGAKVGVMAQGKLANLTKNDKVTLLHAETLNGTVSQTTEKIVKPTSLTTVDTYEFSVTSDANNIYATITKDDSGSGGGDDPTPSPSPDDSTNDIKKSPVEVRAATVTMLNVGADMLASQGFAQAANAVAVEAAEQAKNGAVGAPAASSFTPFAAFGGSSLRAESGSHVDTKGFGINVGFAKEFTNSQGKLLFGPVVEYGGGKYDSYNNDVHGDGGSHYWGFGLMARQTNHDGFYYEGSVRFGRVTSDYSADLPTGVHASYDSASNYWAAHLGVGKVFATGKQDKVDGYLKYFYSHQGGDDTDITLSANGGTNTQRANFDSVNSNRIRIGARYTHKINEMNSFYGGLAYQYEFGGEARAHYAGLGEAPSPSVKGSSGMLELGWQVKPNNGPVTIDLGVTGWAGKQRGGSVQLGATWTF